MRWGASFFVLIFAVLPTAAKLPNDTEKREIERALFAVHEAYSDIIRQRGGVLVFKTFFDSNEDRAFADRSGKKWRVVLHGGAFGGLPHSEFAYDHAAVVACHEVGHHIAGTAFYPRPFEWATAEGQADYFATLKCLRKVYVGDDNGAWLKLFEKHNTRYTEEITYAIKSCTKAWKDNQRKIGICTRSILASLIHGKFRDRDVEEGQDVSLLTPDWQKSQVTYITHPDPQCRLDIHFQGALCQVPHSVLHSDDDPRIGNCNEGEHDFGFRPRCWYKPN